MSAGAPDLDVEPSYIAGMLDAIGRVRFPVSEQADGTFTVRPMLRIKPFETEMREALVGSFLESRGYQYDLVDRAQGDGFFSLQQRSDLEDLEDYLGGLSSTLVRELAFVNGVFAEEFDFEILDPGEIYRFLIIRDELRFGWRPKGRYHLLPNDIDERYELDRSVEKPPLPNGVVRTDYTVEWVAGVFDGIGRYRPSIAKSSEHTVGYSMYPVARMYKAGVHPAFVENVWRFCEDYDLTYGDSSTVTDLNVVFTGPDSIHGFLDVLFPRLLVLAEPSAAMLDDILMRFHEEEEHTKKGFYELLCDFDPVAEASGGPFKHREHTPKHFAEMWRDELDLGDHP